MTTPTDARAAEEAFEAALAGRPGPTGTDALAAFTDALRAEASAPGRPNAALAELLATGLLTDPSRTTVGRPARSSRKRPRMILSTLVVKFAAAGTVAKAAVAGGAVAVALTGVAGATDVLPGTGEDPAVVTTGDSDPVAGDGTGDASTGGGTGTGDGAGDGDGTDSGTGTGTEAGDTTGDASTGGDATDGDATDGDPLVEPAEWAMGPEAGEWHSFGEWVSAGSSAGLVRGEVVSCFARVGKPNGTELETCQALALGSLPADDSAGQPPAPPVQEPVEDGTDDEPAPAPAPAPTADSGTSTGGTSSTGTGHGNGGNGDAGNGHGNAGGNGNGNGAGGNGNGGGRR